MRKQITQASFKAGVGLWKNIRKYLKDSQSTGMDIFWSESWGFIMRTFTIFGKKSDVDKAVTVISAWAVNPY